MTTVDEYMALQAAAWESYQRENWLDTTREAHFKRAWERGYQDAIREVRKQDAEQGAGTPPMDSHPWVTIDKHPEGPSRFRHVASIYALERFTWNPRPGHEQDMALYSDSKYGTGGAFQHRKDRFVPRGEQQ